MGGALVPVVPGLAEHKWALLVWMLTIPGAGGEAAARPPGQPGVGHNLDLLPPVQPPAGGVMDDVGQAVGVGELLHPPLGATQDSGGTGAGEPIRLRSSGQRPSRARGQRDRLYLDPRELRRGVLTPTT